MLSMLAQGEVLQEPLGADARPLLEHPLEVELAQSCLGCHLGQGGLFLHLVAKISDGLGNAAVIALGHAASPSPQLRGPWLSAQSVSCGEKPALNFPQNLID